MTATETKHTPTPWSVHFNRDGRTGTVVRGGEPIANAPVPPAVCTLSAIRGVATAHANAEHIVKCVNAHDALVTVLCASEGLALRLMNKAQEAGASMEGRWLWSLYEMTEEANKQARAALAAK